MLEKTEDKFWEILKTKYPDCFATIAETSLDSAKNQILSDFPYSVIDFDGKLLKKLYSEAPKAVDMLHVSNSEVNLIEFKNGSFHNHDIKLKSVESLIFLFKIFKKEGLLNNFQDIFGLKINFYLIFNDKVKTGLDSTLSSTRMRLRLERKGILANFYPNYEGTYFSRVEILSTTYFESEYINKKFKKVGEE